MLKLNQERLLRNLKMMSRLLLALMVISLKTN